MSWKIIYTKDAKKDAEKIKKNNSLKEKVKSLLQILENDPFQNPPPYAKLVGDLSGAYSRRINIQHRLVYQILKDEHIVKVLRMWTHYE